MNVFSILSEIDPSAAGQPKAPARQPQTPRAPNQPQRPAGAATGASQTSSLKRKAEGPSEGGQVKIARKDAPTPPPRANGLARPGPAPDASKPKSSALANPIPYRGTAAGGALTASKAPPITVKKPLSRPTTPAAQAKPTSSVAKPASSATPTSSANTAGKKSSYAAMLAKAKEVQQAKPVAPVVKHEQSKFLTKKEREELRSQTKAAAKGKAARPSGQAKPTSAKGGDLAKDKRKPADVGYQGTARPSAPAKKPADIGYKGTARPTSVPVGKSSGAHDRSRSASLGARSKPKQGRRLDANGYADWSDLDELEDDEEDYESDASSDMEGGMWDVEKEEQMAAQIARREDAEALAEENRLKREKEERKRRLEQLNKAAAARKKF